MVAKDVATASLPAHATLLHRGTSAEDGTAMSQWSRALLRAVTHELRSPLTVIRAYSSMAIEGRSRLTHLEVRDIMRHIDRSAKLVEVMVGDLETIVKHQTVAMQPVALDLASFLAENVSDFQALAPDRGLQIEFYPGSYSLHADPHRLKQVINNLVENAHKYSRPDGAITISVGHADGYVLIAVEDEGPGVPPEEIEQVFKPFFRGSGSAAAKGTGLGLAICKSLVEAHGGGLSAAPSPCGGFQMLVTLPSAA